MNRAVKRKIQGFGRSEGAPLGWQETRCFPPGGPVHKQLGDRAWPLLTARRPLALSCGSTG
jgi:hypothetical protein